MTQKLSGTQYDRNGNPKAYIDYGESPHYVKVVLVDGEAAYIQHVFDREKTVDELIEYVELQKRIGILSDEVEKHYK